MPIFDYDRKVSPISGAPVEAGGIANKGIGDIGRVVTGIAIDYQNRKNVERHKSDIADYQLAQRDFQTNLNSKKQQALIDGTATYKDLEEKVIQPEMAKFKAEIASRDYIATARPEIENRVEYDIASTTAKERGDIEQMELQDHVNTQVQVAEMAIAEGDDASADQILSDLAGIVGESEALNYRSAAYANVYTMDMRTAQEDWMDGTLSDEEYLSRLDGVEDRASESQLLGKHSRQVATEAMGKRLSFKKGTIQKRDKALNTFKSIRKNDEITAEVMEELERMAGPQWADSLLNASMQTLSGEATNNKKTAKMLTVIEEFKAGKISIERALKQIDKTGGNAEEMGVWIIGRLSEETAKEDGYVVAYDEDKKGTGSPKTGTTVDFLDNLNYYTAKYTQTGMGKSRANYFVKNYKAYDDWRDDNPNPTAEQYTEFRKGLFSKQSSEIIGGFKAPQQEGRTVVRTGMRNGKKVVQYSDGAIEDAD